MTAEGGNIEEVVKRTNVFVAVSLSLLYPIYLGGDSGHTAKRPVVTSQMFLLHFTHTNDRKMHTLVLLQEEHVLGGEVLTTELKTP